MKKIIIRSGKEYQDAVICPECGSKCNVTQEYYCGDEITSIQCHCDCGCIFESYFGTDENGDKLYYDADGTGDYRLRTLSKSEEKRIYTDWNKLVQKEKRWYKKLWRKIIDWLTD